MKFLILILMPTLCFANTKTSKPKFRYGDSVRVKQSYKVGYPEKRAREVGMEAVIMDDASTACDPRPEGDSCDPFSYEIKILKTGDKFEIFEYNLEKIK